MRRLVERYKKKIPSLPSPRLINDSYIRPLDAVVRSTRRLLRRRRGLLAGGLAPRRIQLRRVRDMSDDEAGHDQQRSEAPRAARRHGHRLGQGAPVVREDREGQVRRVVRIKRRRSEHL